MVWALDMDCKNEEDWALVRAMEGENALCVLAPRKLDHLISSLARDSASLAGQSGTTAACDRPNAEIAYEIDKGRSSRLDRASLQVPPEKNGLYTY